MNGAALSPSQALGAAVRRNGHLIAGATALTPFDEMAAREERGHTEEEQNIRHEGVSQWLAWCWETPAGEDPSIERACKRFLSWTREFRRDLCVGMNMEQVAAMFAEGRAAESARARKAFEAPMIKAGYRNTTLSSNKTERARAKMGKAQKGNKHRARSVSKPLL